VKRLSNNETASTQVPKEVVFIDASNAARGGLMVGMHIRSKEGFLQWADGWNAKRSDNYISMYGMPKPRYAYVDGSYASNFKDLSLRQFEALFTEEDVKRLGRLMEYRKGEYPIFLKEVYVKYGILQEAK
jgi:hypothetical protein